MSFEEMPIAVSNLSKAYRLYDKPLDRLKELFFNHRREFHKDFWALRQVSFEIRKGEAFGIIGPNGSGKTTLLRILCGVLQPTSGGVHVVGRVNALLDLGGGFEPDFTGRENVFLQGAILGISRNEMNKRFDEIAAFADIGDFLDRPVREYSGGMFMRLAFAVATTLDSEVLVIDEMLAVGDIFFRQKCTRRLEALRERGVSILLVSHSMPDVGQFCQRAMVLNRGEVLFQGPSAEAIKHYFLLGQTGRPAQAGIKQTFAASKTPPESKTADSSFWPETDSDAHLERMPDNQVGNGSARSTRVAIFDIQGRRHHAFEQGEQASFFYEFEVLQDMEVPIGGIAILNDRNVLVHGKSTLEYGSVAPHFVKARSRIQFRQDIALEIATGEYVFEAGLSTISRSDYHSRHLYTQAELGIRMVRLCHVSPAGKFVVLPRRHAGPVQLMHHGVANLPGKCHMRVESRDGQKALAASSDVSWEKNLNA